ncbi:ninein [Agrilus planipennis]|uniref:Ninein n=1 Tax=Agrilus planipennis TaxID=224129 RepID=A0A1W4XLA6_AGRPL|nr:ninein [Agrilus planipennis]
MDCQSLDPYEKQLFTVFESYDYENCGTLDERGLTQLCQSLHLEDQASELIQQLLKEKKKHRVTFTDFKSGLLTLLGKIQNCSEENGSEESENDKQSPDREISPKYVYGSKKYGRRTRPKIEEEDENENLMNNTMDSANSTVNIPVQKSSSHGDVLHSKKRKTNSKLKRCTSLPGNYNRSFQLNSPVFNNANNDQEFLCTEEMLREAWKKLGVGKDGYLNKNELLLVCNSIGMERLAKGVLRQLSLRSNFDINQRISFQELLNVLQEDDTWADILGPATSISKPINTVQCLKDDPEVTDPENIQHITLGPNATGFVHSDLVIEMWDNAGIPSPKKLIQDLGFDDCQIKVSDLAMILEKEIKSMGNSRSGYTYLHVTLLQAVLTLYQSEIRSLRNILEQMHAEREKLKSDVMEANNRASLLAQEVDDNHARMEKNTQNHVRLLEQKHSDIIKEVTDQFISEKEQMTQLNQSLQQKIKSIEHEEARLREELSLCQTYSSTIEKENQVLNNHISELKQEKLELAEHISFLESEKENCRELENKQLHVEQLLSKLSTLQMENAELRDKNDEMVAEIEQLSRQISLTKSKGNNSLIFDEVDDVAKDNISNVLEGIGAGSKRRNEESPTKEFNPLGLYEGSPRLGKVRKYQKEEELLVVQTGLNESGLDGLSLSSSSGTDSEEMQSMLSRISFLEDILKKHSISIPDNFKPPINAPESCKSTESNLSCMMKHCKELEKAIDFTKNNIRKMLDNKNHQNSTAPLEIASTLNEELNKLSLSTDQETNQTDDFKDLQEELRKCQEENKELRSTCSELENCVELLRTEYERCEEYWSQKLDEERRIFEDEQNQSSEKLQELINKMTEYELQFATSESEYGLPPIEENNLETQFIDLEREFEDYKAHSEEKMTDQEKQISYLQHEIDSLKKEKKEAFDISVQVSSGKIPEKLQTFLTSCIVEKTDLFPTSTGFDLPSPPEAFSDNPKKTLVNNSMNSLCSQNLQTSEENQPSTSTESTLPLTDKINNRQRRFRKHDRNYLQRLCKKVNSNRGDCNNRCCGNSTEEQTVVVPISMFQSLNNRLHHLEQRCKHLQLVLKQQHCHAEQVLQSSWQQFRGEKAELQFFLRKTQEKLENQIRVCNEQSERLSKTDMLVKDLYVENSYLIANVQRLETQCHMLSQFNSSSSI